MLIVGCRQVDRVTFIRGAPGNDLCYFVWPWKRSGGLFLIGVNRGETAIGNLALVGGLWRLAECFQQRC